MTRGAISKLVERLVGKDLVARRVDDTDRRAQRVTLTTTARTLVPRLAQRADENDAEFFGHLDEGQRQLLMELLQDVVARHQLRSVPIE
jgi:DNA-binding MarR family transcriptional regulator